MPRQPRYFIPDLPQHVIQRGNDRQATFYKLEDYKLYKDWLLKAALRHRCDIHAYVLMTNHVHLLLTPRTETAIPSVMQSLGRQYVAYINRTYKRTGTLWEGRYKASLVDTDRYLLGCYRYIEMNPIRAGMVTDPADYANSSYRRNGLGQPDDLVTPHEVYLDLGVSGAERRAQYRGLFETEMDEVLVDDIRSTTNSCLVIGSERFKDQIETILRRTVRPGKSGRPQKTAVWSVLTFTDS